LILGLTGTFFSVIASEEYYQPKRGKDYNEADLMVNLLRGVVTGTTFVLQFFIARHYILDLRLLKAKEIIDPSETLRSTGLLQKMLLEMLICAVHSYPGLEEKIEMPQQDLTIEYSYDIIFTMVTLCRFYLMWRVFTRYSYWNDERAEQVCH
jgi:hypothetical protein